MEIILAAGTVRVAAGWKLRNLPQLAYTAACGVDVETYYFPVELPKMIKDEAELELLLSEPTDPLIEMMGQIEGDLIVLGAGGKMGPPIARMARRASDAAGTDRRVMAVSRFTDRALKQRMESWNVEPLVGDLFDLQFLTSLPPAPNVVYLVGVKFGTSGAQARTWASNAYLPGAVCQQFPDSRIVALSTGNLYGMVNVDGPGSREDDHYNPSGEYPMSAIGRERVFEYFSREGGIRVALIRLNYATELRYGVLVDLAQMIHRDERVSVATGYVDVIWQADANEMILRCLAHTESPPQILNLAGPDRLTCRDLALQLGRLLGKDVQLTDREAPTAFLADTTRIQQLLGQPRTPIDAMLELTADWIRRDQPTWNKPTHFQVRDGGY